MTTSSSRSALVHGTAIRLSLSGNDAAFGVLIRGASGAGKSTLALQLIEGFGALLVADDQVELAPNDHGQLVASCPARIAGLLEVRGVGLVPYPHLQAPQPIDLMVELETGPLECFDRMPAPISVVLAGFRLPTLVLPTAADVLAERVVAGLRLLRTGHWSKLHPSDVKSPVDAAV